jgi:hypothetical protein
MLLNIVNFKKFNYAGPESLAHQTPSGPAELSGTLMIVVDSGGQSAAMGLQ